jgi:hypothetical protein
LQVRQFFGDGLERERVGRASFRLGRKFHRRGHSAFRVERRRLPSTVPL